MTARRAIVLLALAAAAAGALAWSWMRGVAVALPDAPGRIPCVSYSPFRGEESPLVPGRDISAARIEADLAVIARHAQCVRTYATERGLDQVPRLARKLGLKVMLGIWIGRDPKANDIELARALEVIGRDADVISAVIVGNEVMLRRELPEASLARYIDRVRAATHLPITYADVWEFWVQHRPLAKHVSFVTVHILPYWEDHPIGVDHAVDHVVSIHARMAREFEDKRVFIGETGWPSAGRVRERAVPGRIEQARFVRELALAAPRAGIDFNLVEAFDQPWKRALEGTAGGYWGIYDSALQPRFPFQGPVEADPRWWRGWIGAAVGAIALIVLGFARRAALLPMALAGIAIGTIGFAQIEYARAASRGAIEWLVSGITIVTSILIGCLAALALAGRPAPMLRTLRLALLFGAAVVAILLTVDPRYRNVPISMYLLPIASYALLRVAEWRCPARRGELIYASIIAVSVPFILRNETFSNPDALLWAIGSGGLVALTFSEPSGKPE